MKIYTRTGDDGTTGLFGGPRVDKHHLRIEAFGTVDELNCALGLARSTKLSGDIDSQLEQIQHWLFGLGADLSDVSNRADKEPFTRASQITQMEEWIDQLETALPPLKQFVIPGGCDAAAQLHLARAICRRAERRLVALFQLESETNPPPAPLELLNRLSDLLFVQARSENHRAKLGDIPWKH